jgi:hypothetical protein
MMLGHYQQTKNVLVSYDINPPGFFQERSQRRGLRSGMHQPR